MNFLGLGFCLITSLTLILLAFPEFLSFAFNIIARDHFRLKTNQIVLQLDPGLAVLVSHLSFVLKNGLKIGTQCVHVASYFV